VNRNGLALFLSVTCASAPPFSDASPVVATVESAVTYDSVTQRYTYSYTVTNAPASPNQLAIFGVRPTVRPISANAPPGWHAYRGWDRDSSAVVWAIVDPGAPSPNGGRQLYVGPNHIAPGETQSGFTLVSDFPPDSTAEFVAQGFDTIPGGAHAPNPTAPSRRSLWEEGWSGAAIVPRLGGAVGVDDGPLGDAISFHYPVPSPTRGGVDLRFELPREGHIEIELLDVTGRRIASIDDRDRAAGLNSVHWNAMTGSGRRVPAGVYFFRVLFEGRQMGDRRVIVLP